MLGDRRALAVRDAVPAQVSRAQVGGLHGQRSAGTGSNASDEVLVTPAGDSLEFPPCRGLTLPAWRRRLRRRRREAEDPRLRPGVGVDPQRGVVLPRHVQPPRHAHDGGASERLALIAGRFVRRGIPPGGHLPPLRRQRHAGVIALRRSHHAKAPVFADEGDPISGEIDRRRGLRRRRRGAGGVLRLRGCREPNRRRGRERPHRRGLHDFSCRRL